MLQQCDCESREIQPHSDTLNQPAFTHSMRNSRNDLTSHLKYRVLTEIYETFQFTLLAFFINNIVKESSL